jgi:hypothetical protein
MNCWINDVVHSSYPVCSFELARPGGFSSTPPVLVYANSAFCNLINHPLVHPLLARPPHPTPDTYAHAFPTSHHQERLLGTPYHFTYVVNLQHYKQALLLSSNR